MERTEEQNESRKNGKVVLFSLISFFAVFASVDAYFVYKAVNTHTGVVTENAYEKGLAYNNNIKQAKHQKSFKITSNTTYNNGLLTTTISNEDGTPIIGATVVAKIVRDVHNGHDFQKVLSHKGNGIYNTDLGLPLSGIWTVNLDIKWEQHSKQKNYQTTINITN